MLSVDPEVLAKLYRAAQRELISRLHNAAEHCPSDMEPKWFTHEGRWTLAVRKGLDVGIPNPRHDEPPEPNPITYEKLLTEANPIAPYYATSDALELLPAHASAQMCETAALQHHASAATLAMFSVHPEWTVRAAVAANPYNSVGEVMKLTQDIEYPVRFMAVLNLLQRMSAEPLIVKALLPEPDSGMGATRAISV
jgi:hypothetical protein